MAPEADNLLELARSYLGRQPWFLSATEADPPAPIEIASYEVLLAGRPGLGQMLLERGARRFQIFIGWRAGRDVARALKAEEKVALFGAATDGEEQVIVYDALADEELARAILSFATDGKERATRVRLVSSLVSHAALVYDERLFMKCYRVIEEGPRHEAEILFGLDEVGFNALLAPVARWRSEGHDLALVREFLPNALEGRPLALTSLRDLLGDGASPEDAPGLHGVEPGLSPDQVVAQAGGDFAAEMARLGATTAHLHLAMAAAFGVQPLGKARALAGTRGPAQQALDEKFGEAGAFGQAIQLHGDFHLRRVMRSETGWLIAGFGDDPLYAKANTDSSLPPQNGSPLEDVADMYFALGEVAREALAQRPVGESEVASGLSQAWARRNKAAFWRGYVETGAVSELLPSSTELCEELLTGYEAERLARHEATPADD